jgi:hypothetical protein
MPIDKFRLLVDTNSNCFYCKSHEIVIVKVYWQPHEIVKERAFEMRFSYISSHNGRESKHSHLGFRFMNLPVTHARNDL